jgi:hypothetical protein
VKNRLTIILIPMAILLFLSLIYRPGFDGGFPAASRMTVSQAAPAATPELPRVYLDTTYVAPKGRTIHVAAGDDFQDALDRARPGDVITLQAGAIFTGNFTLPFKSGSEWIIVRTSAPDSSLPPPGARVTPEYAKVMPKIVAPNDAPALEAPDGAHHYRFIGIEFTVARNVNRAYNVILLGADQTSTSQLPHDLIFDRVYVHGHPDTTVRRGIALNSASTAVIDSWISDCHEESAESQAIMGWNGPGPFKIVNNYLEGAGENIMFGGVDPKIKNLVPSDIEFRRNHCFKPRTWKTGEPDYGKRHWMVKNLFELKNAQRVLIDGNVFEHNWVDAQNGFAILFTVRNQDGGAPWSVVQDVTFTNNIVRRVAAVINLSGIDNNHPSAQSRRFHIVNNLFEEVNGQRWGGGNGTFLQIGGVPDVYVAHNTILQSGSIIFAHHGPNAGFVFSDNIAAHNEYGMVGDGHGIGNPTIGFYFPGGIFKRNVIAGGKRENYPADNFFLNSLAEAGFVDQVRGDYRLAASSKYKKAATDGKDIGCDVDALGKSAVVGAPLTRPHLPQGQLKQ